MKKQIRMMVAMLVSICAGAVSAAVTYTYSGAGQAGVWTDGANWTASDGTTTGYPGSAATDIAKFPKDAAAVTFDFGGATITFATLEIGEQDSAGTADVTFKNGTMNVTGKAVFGRGTSVRLSEGLSLTTGTDHNAYFYGTFSVDALCSFSATGTYTGFGTDIWGNNIANLTPVIRIAGTFSVRYLYLNPTTRIILEGGTYEENWGGLGLLKKQDRDWSFCSGNGTINKCNFELNFTDGMTNTPALSPDITYVWGRASGGTNAMMNLECGTIELTQSDVATIFYPSAKRSGFNFPEGSKAKVVFSNYTPASSEAFFASQIFSTIGNYVGPHIYVNGLAIESAKQLKSLLNVEFPYKDGKGVAISLKDVRGLVIRIR